MKCLLLVFISVAALAVGCATTNQMGHSAKEPSVIGQSVQQLIQDHADRRIEFFDANGRRIPFLPRGERGSVSIFTKDEDGQDNYTFNEKGVIVKHQRSHGENYSKGVWEPVR